jgi:hypothetical protein
MGFMIWVFVPFWWRAKRRLLALANHAARRCGKIREIVIGMRGRVVAQYVMSGMILSEGMGSPPLRDGFESAQGCRC